MIAHKTQLDKTSTVVVVVTLVLLVIAFSLVVPVGNAPSKIQCSFFNRSSQPFVNRSSFAILSELVCCIISSV
jgi:hypothetical protein